MSYKEKYEEALERAKFLKENTDGVGAKDVSRCFDEIFPELQKSEDDEQIRKEIISFLKEGKPYYCPNSARRQEWVTWLEKRGEQNPTDKVKPKFKVGDWIVRENNVIEQIEKITDLPDNHYQYWTTDGSWFGNATEARLWTIQDAKDGDVLAAEECYVIFKEIDGLNIKCHCTYHYMWFNPIFHINTLQNKTAFQPATKEQCGLLFQKIKEAGYKWDADKKELKKIEQKLVDNLSGMN